MSRVRPMGSLPVSDETIRSHPKKSSYRRRRWLFAHFYLVASQNASHQEH